MFSEKFKNMNENQKRKFLNENNKLRYNYSKHQEGPEINFEKLKKKLFEKNKK